MHFDVLLTRQLQADSKRARRSQQLKVATLNAPMLNICGPIVGVLSQTKGHLSGRARLLTPLWQPFLISVDDSEALARQSFEDLTLSGSNRINAVIVREVGSRRIQTDRYVGSCELAQIGNVSGFPAPISITPNRWLLVSPESVTGTPNSLF